MTYNVKESVDMITAQIKKAKSRGKKQIKVKTYQLDFSGGKPHGLYMLSGMCKGGEGEKIIKSFGYKVSYESSDKQVTVGYNASGEISKYKINPLRTTNMIIEF